MTADITRPAELDLRPAINLNYLVEEGRQKHMVFLALREWVQVALGGGLCPVDLIGHQLPVPAFSALMSGLKHLGGRRRQCSLTQTSVYPLLVLPLNVLQH